MLILPYKAFATLREVSIVLPPVSKITTGYILFPFPPPKLTGTPPDDDEG